MGGAMSDLFCVLMSLKRLVRAAPGRGHSQLVYMKLFGCTATCFFVSLLCRTDIFHLATPEYTALVLMTKASYGLPLYTFQQLRICHQTIMTALVFFK
jgi:hypothetical protein